MDKERVRKEGWEKETENGRKRMGGKKGEERKGEVSE